MTSDTKILCIILFLVVTFQANAIVVFSGYIENNGKMYYGWDIKSATLVKDAHLPSFKQLDGAYAVDKKNLYFAGKRLQKAPKDTVIIYDSYAIVDNKTVYYGDKIIANSDAPSFRLHDSHNKHKNIATDRKHVYCNGEIVSLDAFSFEPINRIYFKDKNGLYSVFFDNFSKKLEDASSSSYHLIDNYPEFLISNNNVYQYGIKTDYNPQTFNVFEHYYATDHGRTAFNKFLLKNNDSIYLDNQALNMDANSFVFLGNNIMKDKNGVYILDYYNSYNERIYARKTDFDPQTTQSVNVKVNYNRSGRYPDFFNMLIISDGETTCYAETSDWEITTLKPICNIDLGSFEVFCAVGRVAICKDKNSVYCISRSIEYNHNHKYETVIDLKMNPVTIKLILHGKDIRYPTTDIVALKDSSKLVTIVSNEQSDNYANDIDADAESVQTIFAKTKPNAISVEDPKNPDPDIDIKDYTYYFIDKKYVYDFYGTKQKKIQTTNTYQQIEEHSLFLKDWESERLKSLDKVIINVSPK